MLWAIGAPMVERRHPSDEDANLPGRIGNPARSCHPSCEGIRWTTLGASAARHPSCEAGIKSTASRFRLPEHHPSCEGPTYAPPAGRIPRRCAIPHARKASRPASRSREQGGVIPRARVSEGQRGALGVSGWMIPRARALSGSIRRCPCRRGAIPPAGVSGLANRAPPEPRRRFARFAFSRS